MSINLALHHILFSKGACTNITKVLIISFVVLTTSNVMMRENAYASSSSSDLARLNSDYKLQTLQQKVLLQNVSPFTSTLPPADFAFFYSFGIIGETNNTISSEHDVYIKDNEEGVQPTNITFTISSAQMQGIWTSAIETGFFQIKNNFTENCDKSGNCILVTPEHYFILKITGNNSTHTVIARDGYAFPHDEEYQKFKSLVDEIDRMVVTILSQENGNNDNALPSSDREPERGFI
jgi:hypothetical protein